MIYIGAPHTDKIIRKFDGQTIDGITFKLEKAERVQCLFSYDTDDDDRAAKAAKTLLKTDPEFAGLMTRVQIKGRLY